MFVNQINDLAPLVAGDRRGLGFRIESARENIEMTRAMSGVFISGRTAILFVAVALAACGGGGGGGGAEPPTASPPPPPVAPSPPPAQATYSLAFESDFSENPFWTSEITSEGPFLSDFGDKVTFSKNQLLIRQNVTDTYARIHTERFWPSSVATIEIEHKMTPSSESSIAANHFMPSISFVLIGGRTVSFSWQRSAYAPDYCSIAGAQRKLIARFSVAPFCEPSNIDVEQFYGREITSVVSLDMNSGRLLYEAFPRGTTSATASIAKFSFSIPEVTRQAIKEVHIGGYGWFTGHEVEIYKLRTLLQPSAEFPLPPLGRAAAESTAAALISLPRLTTTPRVDSFAAKWYWQSRFADGIKRSHLGTDIALTNGGIKTTDTTALSSPVYSMCGTGSVSQGDYLYTPGDADRSALRVTYTNCNGQNVSVYYGHIEPAAKFRDVAAGASIAVERGDFLGTVMSYPGGVHHLHLTVDRNTASQRNLLVRRFYVCDLALSTESEVTDILNCVDGDASSEPTSGKGLIRLGFGQAAVLKYRAPGSASSTSNYERITRAALTNAADDRFRFISIYDLLGIR